MMRSATLTLGSRIIAALHHLDQNELCLEAEAYQEKLSVNTIELESSSMVNTKQPINGEGKAVL